MDEVAVTFPPLLVGGAVTPGTDPFDAAQARAALGCDGGTVLYDLRPDALRAAFVFAPDVSLRQAMAMVPICGIGFQNALGALAPPEVAVHLTWQGGILVNGASCGGFQVAASANDPDAIPDWLVVGLHVPLWPEHEDTGVTPDTTTLFAEGCGEITGHGLLESMSRHMLVWLNRWEQDGIKPVHAEWRGMAHGIGEPLELWGKSGVFMGVDEHFGLLLRDGAQTHLLPLTSLLEEHS